MNASAAPAPTAGRRAPGPPLPGRAPRSDLLDVVAIGVLFLAAAGLWLALIGLAF